jgi:hypothetical protein
MHNDTSESPLTFSLAQIASWKNQGLEDHDDDKTASIPALQRGLVWEPKKHELLWDSLLRGFPIGALVVTPWSERLRKRSENSSSDTGYHLLDGQQRCHAISLGFEDPFGPEAKSEEVNTILWLDLQPAATLRSTRNFWIRATTTAHPWGYQQNDDASRLNAGQIQGFLGSPGLEINPASPGYRRPSPVDLWPAAVSAKTPVPLGWLMRLATVEDEVEFWSKLADRAELEPSKLWAVKVVEFCRSNDVPKEKQLIHKAVRGSVRVRVVALEAPEELMEISEREKSEGDREDVSNIEQLFQRLNTLGTQLEGEELAYSMIKAYWPELEAKIDEASTRRMPPARMVSLAVRAALAKSEDRRLPGHPTVSRIRAIAKTGEGKKLIQEYIENDLCRACDLVDEWLSYGLTLEKSGGLVPVLVSSIAINSREVYLLLLHFANRRINDGIQDSDEWRNAMRALATTIHWFAIDQAKAVNLVFESCASETSVETVGSALRAAIDQAYLHPIPEPGGDEDSSSHSEVSNNDPSMSLKQFVTAPNEADLAEWRWGKLIWHPDDDAGNLIRQRQWEGILGLRWNRELLIYAQRAFMAERFEDYNPQRKDLWQDQDRPWDFDHILASKYVHNRKDGAPFRESAGEWAWTIGNLRAWPAADNRSDQALTAADKISGNEQLLRNSFMLPSDEAAFSAGDGVRWNPEESVAFIGACRARLLRIYQEWYDSVRVGDLILTVAADSEDTENYLQFEGGVQSIQA